MMEKKKESLLITCITGAILYVVFIFFVIHYRIIVREQPDLGLMDAINVALTDLMTRPFMIFPFPDGVFQTVAIWTFLAALAGLLWYSSAKSKAHYDPNKVQGDAEWMKSTKDYNKKFADPKGVNDAIFSRNVKLNIDNQKTRRNQNVFIIGGSGAGKSYNFVGPNIMQANTSLVITDPSGGLLEEYGHFLEYKGYRVKCFNLDHMDRGNHYNPFKYIKDDQDIMIMVNTIMENTTPPNASKGDPFWDNAEKLYWTALCAYVFHYLEKKDQNFNSVIQLLKISKQENEEEDSSSGIDHLFEEIRKKDPTSFALAQYDKFNTAPGKTRASILISGAARLQAFDLGPVAELTSDDDIDLDRVGDEKTALFIIIPTADKTFVFLAAMMYSQLFQTLYSYSENTAAYSSLIIDGDRQVWKTFRADSPNNAKKRKKEAEAFLERAKGSTIAQNKDYGWWELRTDRDELVGYRGSKEEAEKALERLKEGKVILNSEQSNRGRRLPIHVRMLLDEFANTGRIPQFTEKVATIRKYEISVCIIVQSLSQLKNMYKEEWEALTGNCDNTIYLGGGADYTSTEWLSKLLGKETRAVLNVSYSKNGGGQSINRTGVELFSPSQLRTMDEKECLIIPKSLNAIKDQKYPSEKHPNRKLVLDLNAEKGGYTFNLQKAKELQAEQRTIEENILDTHGPIDPSSGVNDEKKNDIADQRAAEHKNNMDCDGNPLIDPPKKVGGEGSDKTLPLPSKADAEDTIAKTLRENEEIWGPEELMYESAPAGD